MGSLFKSKTKTTSTSSSNSTNTQNQSGITSQTSNTGPSQFQQPYLTAGFDAAKANLDKATAAGGYTGITYAGMSDQQKADMAASRDLATTAGKAGSTLTGLGTDLSGYYGKASSSIDDYLKYSSADHTADLQKAAAAYAANPYIDAQIDASTRDVTRTLNEETLPGIDRSASGNGGLNSSRAGVAQGIAQRGAADRVADIGASIRSNAYSQGMTIAQAQEAAKTQAMQSIIAQYTQMGGAGISALGSGTTASLNSANVLGSIDQAEQADRQGKATADYQKWLANDTRNSDLLARYMQIVGGTQWGSSGTATGTSSGTATGTATGSGTGTSTQTSSPGLGNIIAGGLSMAGGLGWSPLGK